MKKNTQPFLKILRRHQVEERTGLSRSTIYTRISENSFPRPVTLGGKRAVGWLESEIDNWIQELIAARHEQ